MLIVENSLAYFAYVVTSEPVHNLLKLCEILVIFADDFEPGCIVRIESERNGSPVTHSLA